MARMLVRFGKFPLSDAAPIACVHTDACQRRWNCSDAREFNRKKGLQKRAGLLSLQSMRFVLA
jgi:hypothetical protein